MKDKPHLKPGQEICRVCGQKIIEPLEAKCERCGKIVPSKPFPAGWYQRGISKYSKLFQRWGTAWYCHECKIKTFGPKD